ncbi:hypothetical protein [Oceanobacillus profundus]|uniref:Uncharacterized protein n=1 Tax=Oceanobacillus profundus TaxID=372463 RepID=A0A417YB92_9BACI|nr:hypothetical protein [Oceanobacillus profundus]RHW29963.1 hypothetical protein D1B32_19090 [Oceanobacillus profundus]
MKVALIHIGYFIVIIITSIVSFGIIFGAGFTEGIDLFTLFIPFVLSVLWNFAYVWQFLSMSSNKTDSIRPSKNWTFISMFLSGILIVYSLFLTTLLIPIGSVISVLLLLIWFALLFAYTKSKSSIPQSIYGSILFIVSLILAYLIFEYLITM